MIKDYNKIADSTLNILDKKPWDNIALKEIQTKSKVKKFNLLIKNKKDLLIKLNNYFDYKVSSKISDIENSNYKDMIFEVIMMRFDVLQENRKGIISIFNSFKRPKIYGLNDSVGGVTQTILLTPATCAGITFIINEEG